MRSPPQLPSQGWTQEWMRNSKGNSLRTVVSSSIHVIVWWGLGVSFWSVWLRLEQRWQIIKSALLFLSLGVLNSLFKALRDGSHSKHYSTMTYILLLLVLQSAAAFEHFPREAFGGFALPRVLLTEGITQGPWVWEVAMLNRIYWL